MHKKLREENQFRCSSKRTFDILIFSSCKVHTMCLKDLKVYFTTLCPKEDSSYIFENKQGKWLLNFRSQWLTINLAWEILNHCTFFPNLALLLNKTNLNSRTYIVQPHYFVDIRIGTDFAFKINIIAFSYLCWVQIRPKGQSHRRGI